MSEPQPPRQRHPIYVLRLQSLGDGDDARRLRWALKLLLRRFQFRCTDLREEASDESRPR